MVDGIWEAEFAQEALLLGGEVQLPVRRVAADVQLGEVDDLEGQDELAGGHLVVVARGEAGLDGAAFEQRVDQEREHEDQQQRQDALLLVQPQRLDLELAVEDSGIGIPEKELELIFNSFHQVNNGQAENNQGTGLGLAIVSRLVQLMNGEVKVSSQVGLGSRFEVHLPQLEIGHKGRAGADQPKNIYDRFPFSGQKVLVVDDVDYNSALVVQMLAAANLKVITASSGSQTLTLAKEEQPQLILLDLRMPVMDGFECFRRLGQDPVTAKIPVIALTALATVDTKEQVARLGFQGILTKPITLEAMLKKMHQVLQPG